MVNDENKPGGRESHTPSASEQLINQLRKEYDHLEPEVRRVKIIEEIREMGLSDGARESLLRRVE